jgi:hypothetical protein
MEMHISFSFLFMFCEQGHSIYMAQWWQRYHILFWAQFFGIRGYLMDSGVFWNGVKVGYGMEGWLPEFINIHVCDFTTGTSKEL